MARGSKRAVPKGPRDILVGSPAFDDVMVTEVMQRGGGRGTIVAPGVVSTSSGREIEDLVFARQCIPQAVLIDATSAAELADHIVFGLGALETDWLAGQLRLDVDVSDGPRAGSRPRDDNPLAEGLAHLRDILEKKRVGRARKRGVESASTPADERMEFLLVGAWRGYLGEPNSIGDPLTSWPVPMAAGRALVVTDKSAPSSAHRKLDEALVWIGDRPTATSTVLDLGAAPGGWSHVALRHDARVIAVDRGNMDAGLMATGRVTHLRKDAFLHAPLEEADWLVCDIIAEPARTLALLATALESERLAAFVVTVKLRLPIDFTIVDEARALLDAHPAFSTRVKNLFHNKVEVTLMGRRK